MRNIKLTDTAIEVPKTVIESIGLDDVASSTVCFIVSNAMYIVTITENGVKSRNVISRLYLASIAMRELTLEDRQNVA